MSVTVNIFKVLNESKITDESVINAFKGMIKKEEVTEEEVERAEYLIKKLGIDDGALASEINYLSGFNLDIESFDKEFIAKTKIIMSFKEKVMRGWSVDEVRQYIEYFAGIELDKLTNKQIEKLGKIKEYLGGDSVLSNPSLVLFQDIDNFSIENMEVFKEASQELSLSLDKITGVEMKKMQLVLGSIGVEKIEKISKEKLGLIRLIKVETGLDIASDTKLEVKEKLWQIDGLDLKTGDSNKAKGVIYFVRNYGKKISDLEEAGNNMIEDIGIKSVNTASNAVNIISAADINIDDIFRGYENYLGFFQLIKRVSGKQAGELIVQEMHYLNEISEVFCGKKAKDLAEKEASALVKAIAAIDFKISDWENHRSFYVKSGLVQYGISIESREEELKFFGQELKLAGVRLADFNEEKAKELQRLKDVLGSIEKAKEIKSGLGYQNIFEIKQEDLKKVKILSELKGAVELQDMSGEDFKKIGVLLNEYEVNIRGYSADVLRSIVSVTRLFADKKSKAWFSSKAKDILDCSENEIKKEVASIKEKAEILGFEKITEIDDLELRYLEKIFRINEQQSLSKEEATSLSEVYKIIEEKGRWKYISEDSFEEIIWRVKSVNVDLFHLAGELDYLKRIDIFDRDSRVNTYKEVLRQVSKKGDVENHKFAVSLIKEIWGEIYNVGDTEIGQIKALVKADKISDEKQQELVLEVFRECKFRDDINASQVQKMSEVSAWVEKWGGCKDAMITVGSGCDEYLKYDHYLQEEQIKGICSAGGTEDL